MIFNVSYVCPGCAGAHVDHPRRFCLWCLEHLPAAQQIARATSQDVDGILQSIAQIERRIVLGIVAELVFWWLPE